MQRTGVSIEFVRALLDRVPAAGRSALLHQAGIDPALMRRDAARVESGHYAGLMRAAVAALEDEFFGRDTRRLKPGSFAMLCHAVIFCRSLQKALTRAVRFYGLLLDDSKVQLTDRDGWLTLEVHPLSPLSSLFAHENLLLFLHRLSCWLVNRRIEVVDLGFGFPRPRHAGEYGLIFGLEAQFGRPWSALRFDARYGALPVVRDEAALKEFLAVAPENLFVRYRPSHGTALRVRRQLASMASTDWPNFRQLARALGMSASTLHRRLAAEDSSFQQIKDQIRGERAISLLRQSDRSIMAIAEELGFAEPSAFHRAFRKWSGSPPGRFRRTPPIAAT